MNHKGMALLNAIARQELKVHRHYWALACGPHPHDGPHKVICDCGKAKR